VPGKTKTRLQPFLDGEACCLLHQAFLLDIYDVLKKIKTDCDILVYYTPEGHLSALQALLPDVNHFFPQQGQDLGEKMFTAIAEVLHKGYESCLLLGSDVPLLQVDAIDDAFQLLETSDIVICPTEDGGYYLIGMKEPCKEVFSLEMYSVETVFEKTQQSAFDIGKTCAVGLPTRDVDEPHDLLWLKESLALVQNDSNLATREVLQKIFFEKREEEHL